jgi:glycerol-3-phosphate acyltransferase PlsY
VGQGNDVLATLAFVDWSTAPYLLADFVLAYLIGSIPFGVIFAWLAGAGDVRKIGSGNIGATNVLRTGKKWAAAATLLCDAGKGAAAVLLARHVSGEIAGGAFAATAGLGAFLGHLFPLWLGFKGGKGVATFLGVTLALFWPVGVLACGSWLIAALAFRISSLAALVAAAMTPLYFLFWYDLAFWSAEREMLLFALLAVVMAMLIFFTHRANIGRLAHNREPRIGSS